MKKRVLPSFSPFEILFIAILVGPIVAGPLTAISLMKTRAKSTAILLASSSISIGLGCLIGAIAIPYPWWWSSLLLFGFNLVSGLLLAIVCDRLDEGNVPGETLRGDTATVFGGIIGGAGLNVIIWSSSFALTLLIAESLFDTYIPVTIDDNFTSVLIFTITTLGALYGAVAGAVLTYRKPTLSPLESLAASAIFCATHHFWFLAIMVFLLLPGYLASAATNAYYLFGHYLLAEVLSGFWIALWITYKFCGGDRRSFFRYVGAPLPLIVALAALAITTGLGYPTEGFLALGNYLERHARTEGSLWCYRQALDKSPNPKTGSYLQFRVALLDHKLGRDEQAKIGFRRVVATYNDQEELVKKANRYLENLKVHPAGKRVVLPGVESRSKERGSYCYPNSLALVLAYWGMTLNADEIGSKVTGINRGSHAFDVAWLANDRGIEHLFLPMADSPTIKRLIDAAVPVLVFVPAHVFVIFGYDEALRTFVTYDVATRDVWTDYFQDDFVKSWKRQLSTLVLAYPPNEERRIPPDILLKARKTTASYIHLELAQFKESNGQPNRDNLSAAVAKADDFFLPMTLYFRSFPGRRREIQQMNSTDTTSAVITRFYSDDYDQGLNIWGQIHEQDDELTDEYFDSALEYQIGTGHFDQIRTMATAVDDLGTASASLLGDLGLIELAGGKLQAGLDLLERAKQGDLALYQGLAELSLGRPATALPKLERALTTTIKEQFDPKDCGCAKKSDESVNSFLDRPNYVQLDPLGFSTIAVVNSLLLSMNDFGQSGERIVEAWETWLQFQPFDAPVAAALAEQYRLRLERLGQKDETSRLRLQRKIELADERATIYGKKLSP